MSRGTLLRRGGSIMSVKFPLPLPFLRTKEAARFIGVSPHTLEKHRIYGTGPNYSKVKGQVFYAIGDLTEWGKRGAKRATADPGKTTVLGAIPANRRATRLAGAVR